MRYLYLIMPVTLLLLSRVVSKKEIIVHIFLSIPFILILTSHQLLPEFYYSQLKIDVQDLDRDYDGMMIVDRDRELIVASKAWQGNLYFVWLDDYLASKNKTNILKQYEYKEPVNGHLYNRLFFIMGRERVSDENYPDKNLTPSLSNYVKDKCYRIICVYRKQE